MTTPLNPPPQRVPSDSSGMARFLSSLVGSVRLIFERVRHVDVAPVRIISGEGSPEGSEVGAVGWIYLRSDGGSSTTLYVKESGTGNTGWVAK